MLQLLVVEWVGAVANDVRRGGRSICNTRTQTAQRTQPEHNHNLPNILKLRRGLIPERVDYGKVRGKMGWLIGRSVGVEDVKIVRGVQVRRANGG